MVTDGIAAGFEQMHLREGKMSLKYLDDELRSQFVDFSMKKFTNWFDEFKNKIQMLIETGQLSRLFVSGKNFKSHHEDIDAGVPALVLNMDDLSIGFFICLVSVVLSVVAFICEVAVARIHALATHELIVGFLIRAMAKMRFGLT